MDKGGLSVNCLTALAPFMGRDATSEILKNMVDAHVSIEELAAIAPFVHKDVLGSLFQRVMSTGSIYDHVDNSLDESNDANEPFDESVDIDALLEEPHKIPDSMRRDIALHLAENGEFDEIEELFDLLDEQTQIKIVKKAIEADDLDFLDGHIEPHKIPSAMRRDIALHLAENGDFDEIEELFSFLDEQTQVSIVDKAIEASDLDFLDGHIAHLPAEAKNKIALALAHNGDFDDIALLISASSLDEQTLLKVVELAIEANETDFLKSCYKKSPASTQAKISQLITNMRVGK